MQSIKWITFGISGDVVKTAIHFFPCSGDVSAPYPARCRLSIFGSGAGSGANAPRQSINLDGPRLSQPDGLRLEDAFPFLAEPRSRLLGIEIELVTFQPRVDLAPSLCVIELRTAHQSIKFRPHRVETQNLRGVNSGLILKDAYSYCSLIMVNSGAVPCAPELGIVPGGQDGDQSERRLESFTMAPGSVKEVGIGAELLRGAGKKECSWGEVNAANLFDRSEPKSGVAGFLMHCDSRTNLPVSVSAI